MRTFFEKTLEEIVFENIGTIHERGLPPFFENNQRQFKVKHGVIDILSWEIKEDILYAHVIELKRDIIDSSAYFQAISYWETLILETIGCFKDFEIDIILIGTNVSESVTMACMTSNIIQVFSYNYGYNGIEFESNIAKFSEAKKSFIETEKVNDSGTSFKLKSPII